MLITLHMILVDYISNYVIATLTTMGWYLMICLVHLIFIELYYL